MNINIMLLNYGSTFMKTSQNILWVYVSVLKSGFIYYTFSSLLSNCDKVFVRPSLILTSISWLNLSNCSSVCNVAVLVEFSWVSDIWSWGGGKFISPFYSENWPNISRIASAGFLAVFLVFETISLDKMGISNCVIYSRQRNKIKMLINKSSSTNYEKSFC